ncbi:MAG: zinc ribbon domain-containing protein [Candidatus Odinarchaeota archaeon]
MPIGDWYIPEGKLTKNLVKLIPGEDTVIYTTTILAETGDELMGHVVKVGELAVTNRGLAFYAKRKGLTGGLISFRGGPIQEYIRYDQISKIESKEDRILIRIAPDIDAEIQKERWYELKVEQSKPYEDDKTFKKRRKQFSSVVEHAMYRYRTGQAKPVLPKKKHPAVAERATPRRRRRRRVQYCPKCGAFLEDPAAYCESCGSPLHPPD